IVVTGCSAGSYGSIAWSAHVAEHYKDSAVVQFGDSGAGVITANFFQQSFPPGPPEGALPPWTPPLDPASVDIQSLSLADIYVAVAAYYARHRFSQYNTDTDENQTCYFTVMRGDD